MQLSRDHQNVCVLALCQALFMTGQSMMFILAGLVGADLAENKALATLPITVIIITDTLQVENRESWILNLAPNQLWKL